MTKYTDSSGNTSDTKSTTYCYGPYLQKIPTNGFATTAVQKLVLSGEGSAVTSTASGWYLETDTGKFNAVDSDDHLKL